MVSKNRRWLGWRGLPKSKSPKSKEWAERIANRQHGPVKTRKATPEELARLK